MTFYRGERRKVAIDFNGQKSRTRQEFAEECDINILMSRYEKTGVAPRFNERQPQYLDCTGLVDFQTSLEVFRQASDAFMRLPARVRREFDNDPEQFVKYATDPENVGQMREWGLAEPEKVEDGPLKVEVVNTPLDPPPTGGGSKAGS